MVEPQTRYWFPAKRYGWGWGLPVSWEGWTVMAVWLAAVIAAAVLLAPHHMPAFALTMALLALLMTGISWLKGEPPHWRWGDAQS